MTAAILSSVQERALEIIIATGHQTEAAKAVGVTDRTMRRWLTTPSFVAALRAAQDRKLDSVAGRMAAAADDAVDLLQATIADQDAPIHARLRAAEIILDSCLRWTELRSIVTRLEALENEN